MQIPTQFTALTNSDLQFFGDLIGLVSRAVAVGFMVAIGVMGVIGYLVVRELTAIRKLLIGALQARTDEDRRTVAAVQSAKFND
jgi:hypothetical protein